MIHIIATSWRRRSRMKPQPLGDRRVNVEVEHVPMPRLEAEFSVKRNRDLDELAAVLSDAVALHLEAQLE